ncbi:MAG: hypothetical protein HY711_00410 [Candidatus Melainabacteria bacterium]|nr:hypothetical protein [Candidatus Melainabacteria bacterium]
MTERDIEKPAQKQGSEKSSLTSSDVNPAGVNTSRLFGNLGACSLNAQETQDATEKGQQWAQWLREGNVSALKSDVANYLTQGPERFEAALKSMKEQAKKAGLQDRIRDDGTNVSFSNGQGYWVGINRRTGAEM